MTTNVQLASTPTADTPEPCIFLRHGQHRYVLGRVGEGMQRNMIGRKLPTTGISNIFLSGVVGWESAGGLLGLLLTVGGAVTAAQLSKENENAERQKKSLRPRPSNISDWAGVHIHGGENITHLLASARTVIFRQPLACRMHEIRDDPRAATPDDVEPDWQDENIRVWYVPVARNSPSRKRRRTDEDENGTEDSASNRSWSSELKQQDGISNTDISSLLVEDVMFKNDAGEGDMMLLLKKVRDIRPDDVALTITRELVARYTGPYTKDGKAPSNGDDDVWIVPRREEDKQIIKARTGTVRTASGLSLPRTVASQTSICYIAKPFERRGKYDAKLGKELGVANPQIRYLCAGQSITTESGNVVTPEQVLGESLPPNGFAVADIPDEKYIEPFLGRPEWSNQKLMAGVRAMYWFLARGLVEDPRIQKFMEERPDIKHVLCSPETCPNMITNTGASELQMKLHRLDAKRFPIPKFDNTVELAPEGKHLDLGRVGQTIELMPRYLYKDDPEPFADLAAAVQELPREAIELSDAAKTKVSDLAFLANIKELEKDIPGRDTEIVCLGTGSSAPSKYRNVSGTLIRAPGEGNFLLDCGEGTLGQMKRMYGAEGTAEILRGLRCIVISHVHADHHNGTAGLIRAWHQQKLADGDHTSRLAISCIKRYRKLLKEVSQADRFGWHRLFFPNCHDVSVPDEEMHATVKDFDGEHDDFGLRAIRRVEVPHCYRSHAVELELASGLRVAYSGDCRPSTAFAEACRGAHLLVHECTFNDDMGDHARQKRHSTMSEALDVAAAMAARRVLLTHFSQRYSKSDSLRRRNAGEDGAAAAAAGGDQAVLLAYDMMTCRLGEWREAVEYMPAIEKLMESLAE